MKVLICGSRYYKNYDKILNIVKSLKDNFKNIVIIEGGASGADEFAKKVAIELHIDFKEYKADWKKYGRAAGPKRNQLMLDSENPDLVIAFHENLQSSKGTKDMINRAKKNNIKVEVFN